MRVAVCNLNGQSGHEAGRALAQKLYQMETGQAMPEIRTAPQGKPYFADSPLHFSISHTSKHAFCAMGYCEVGIDAEELDRQLRPVLLRRIFSPEERVRVLAAEDPHRAALALWVLKEASVKLSGEGLQGFPNGTDFSPDDSRVRLWDGCIYALFLENPDEGVTFHAF